MSLLDDMALIPICMHCRRIRNGNDSWEVCDLYPDAHVQSQFTHGICPECAQAIYGLILDNQQRIRESK